MGTVLKAHGLKGDLKIKVFTDDLSRFKKYKSFEVAGVNRRVRAFRPGGAFHMLSLEGIDTKEDADRLNGKPLLVDRSEAGSEPLISDYIGLDVVAKEKGPAIGRIEAYVDDGQFGLLELALTGGKKLLIPCEQRLWGMPDLTAGQVVFFDLDGFYLSLAHKSPKDE